MSRPIPSCAGRPHRAGCPGRAPLLDGSRKQPRVAHPDTGRQAPPQGPQALAVLALTAGLSCSALSAATAAPAPTTGHGSPAGVVALEIPTINTTPPDVTVTAGEPAAFPASSGDPDATQQWQVSQDGGATFVDIPGASSTWLELPGVSYSQNGFEYRSSFTNADGTAYTDAATLTVTASRPEVTADPVSTSVKSGARFTFTASAQADPAPSIQWQVRKEDGVVRNMVGATAARYSGTPSTAHSGRRFRAVFTNPDSSVNTPWAILTVTASKPIVVTTPSNVTVNAGKVATFIAKATADPAPRTQWQVRPRGSAHFEDIAGATTASYSFKPTLADSGALYRVVFTNKAGETTTSAATLTVHGTVPGKPRSVTAQQTGKGLGRVTWAAPATAGSAPITSYDVGYSAGQWGNGTSKPASARSATFSGLARGRYVFSVAAVNAAGGSVRVTVLVTVK